MRGSCEFILYHTSRTIEPHIPPHSPSSLNPVDFVTAAIVAASSSSQQHPVISANPDLKLGVDLTIRESEVVLSEGDSMQGSHYCAFAGTYILQWRLSEPAASIQHTSFDFSLTGPKCKIMFYYEVLDSENFR